MKHDYFHGLSLSEVIARLVDDSGLPLKAIAAETGKPYSTLYRELDGNDDGAKLGVDTLLLLMRACHMEGSRLGSWPPKNPPAPLMWLAGKCGFRCVPVDAEPDHPSVEAEILDDYEALCAMQKCIREWSADPSRIAELARAAQSQIEETAEQYRREWEERHASKQS